MVKLILTSMQCQLLKLWKVWRFPGCKRTIYMVKIIHISPLLKTVPSSLKTLANPFWLQKKEKFFFQDIFFLPVSTAWASQVVRATGFSSRAKLSLEFHGCFCHWERKLMEGLAFLKPVENAIVEMKDFWDAIAYSCNTSQQHKWCQEILRDTLKWHLDPLAVPTHPNPDSFPQSLQGVTRNDPSAHKRSTSKLYPWWIHGN